MRVLSIWSTVQIDYWQRKIWFTTWHLPTSWIQVHVKYYLRFSWSVHSCTLHSMCSLIEVKWTREHNSWAYQGGWSAGSPVHLGDASPWPSSSSPPSPSSSTFPSASRSPSPSHSWFTSPMYSLSSPSCTCAHPKLMAIGLQIPLDNLSWRSAQSKIQLSILTLAYIAALVKSMTARTNENLTHWAPQREVSDHNIDSCHKFGASIYYDLAALHLIVHTPTVSNDSGPSYCVQVRVRKQLVPPWWPSLSVRPNHHVVYDIMNISQLGWIGRGVSELSSWSICRFV